MSKHMRRCAARKRTGAIAAGVCMCERYEQRLSHVAASSPCALTQNIAASASSCETCMLHTTQGCC